MSCVGRSHSFGQQKSKRDRARASVGGCGMSRLRGDRTVTFRSSVAKELPNLAHFRDHLQIKIRYNYFVFVPTGLRDDLSPWIAEVTLAVKLSNAPWLFDSDPINGADEVSVGHGVGWLFEFPQIFREASDRRGRIEYDLCTV